MKRPTVAYSNFDVVVVPFPYTDLSAQKRRPALVLSSRRHFNAKTGHCLLAMVTSEKNASWPLDVAITDLEAAGLPAPSVARMKLFTLDQRLILKAVGKLARRDAENVRRALGHLLETS